MLVCIVILTGCKDIEQAREEGRQEGYNQGYKAGKKDGRAEGDSEGFSRGETVGYVKGYTSGSITFFHEHLIPSLGLAFLTTFWLFVVWLTFRCVIIFLFPPCNAALLRAGEQAETARVIRQGLKNVGKEKAKARAERARLDTQEKVLTLLMEAGTAHNVNLAKIDESKRALFERLFADLGAAIGEEKRLVRREFDKKYSLMSEFINGQKELEPSAKLALEKELLELYKKLISTK